LKTFVSIDIATIFLMLFCAFYGAMSTVFKGLLVTEQIQFIRNIIILIFRVSSVGAMFSEVAIVLFSFAYLCFIALSLGVVIFCLIYLVITMGEIVRYFSCVIRKFIFSQKLYKLFSFFLD
ncbi:MAG: hypothetical protein RR291_02340, partial [Clostridia bacterium]